MSPTKHIYIFKKATVVNVDNEDEDEINDNEDGRCVYSLKDTCSCHTCGSVYRHDRWQHCMLSAVDSK